MAEAVGMRHALLTFAVLFSASCATTRAGLPVDSIPAAPPSPDAQAAADSDDPPRGRRYYAGRPYGSEAQFNPVSLVINGGLDQMRVEDANRVLDEFPWKASAANVARSIKNTERALRLYGWSNWLTDEVFPLSTKTGGGGQWAPNYMLHLFAGGMTGVRITEWYEQHGTPYPEVSAFVTLYAWHFLTEMVERPYGNENNVDAITDLLVFDSAAFFIWRSERVQRLFSGNVEMTNWPGQPSLNFPGPTIQNMQMTALVRVALPWIDDWRPMTTLGAAFLMGISRRRGENDWISLGAGWDPGLNPVLDEATGKKTVILNPNVGVFYDREGSLLASLIYRARRQEPVLLNIYPGVVRIAGFSPGLWAHWVEGSRVRFGVATTWGPGIGADP